eukprot:2099666-Rhodomonas_salina.1
MPNHQVNSAISLHCEIKYKKPHFQYNLYQESGFLSLISGCTCVTCNVRYRHSGWLYRPTHAAVLTQRMEVPGFDMRGTDIALPMRCAVLRWRMEYTALRVYA